MIMPAHPSQAPQTDRDLASVVRFRTDRQPNMFAQLNNVQSQLVMARSARVRLDDDEFLFRQGARHEGVFLVESGLIRTFYISPAGREITLAYWQPGNIVGTPQVMGRGVHMWSGVAVKETQALSFRGEDLYALMQEIPAFAIGVVRALEFKGKCLSALVQMLGTRSVSERLAMLLCNLADIHGQRQPEGITIGPPFTHEAFAQMIGASRQWVTITLDRFQEERLIRVGRRRTVILRPDLLRKHRSGGEGPLAD
jgi:CRP-like cAMP-binding protein